MCVTCAYMLLTSHERRKKWRKTASDANVAIIAYQLLYLYNVREPIKFYLPFWQGLFLIDIGLNVIS